MTDHYDFMANELDSLRVGLDKLRAERDELRAHCSKLGDERVDWSIALAALAEERDALTARLESVVASVNERGMKIEWYNQQLGQARRDLAETRERLEYHMRRASIMATGAY